MRILLPLVHLLLELLGLFLVHKRQTSHALLQLETVKEGPVLVVGEGVVDLLIPEDSSVRWLSLSANDANDMHEILRLNSPIHLPV